jgi:hypothetical protein
LWGSCLCSNRVSVTQSKISTILEDFCVIFWINRLEVWLLTVIYLILSLLNLKFLLIKFPLKTI